MRLFRQLRALFRRGRLDDELRDELAQHLAWKAERLVAEGVPEDEARRRAAVEVGNVTRLREEARAIWGFPRLDTIVQDARYGVRVLRKSPIFAVVAVGSLAIGIGTSAAVFSLADAVLLRTMAVRDPGRVVLVRWTSGPVYPFSSLSGYGQQNASGLASTSFSRAAYESFRREAASQLDVLGFADLYQVNISADGDAELGTAHAVSGNYFDVLGVAPQLGRALGDIDDRLDAPPAAVISDRLWHRRFGGAQQTVGRTLLINSVPFVVVGITPPSFHGTGQVGTDPDVFVPLALHARVMPNDDPPGDPNFWWVLMIGRLKPGVATEQARTALDVLLKRTVAAAKPALMPKDLPRVELLPGGRGQAESRDEMRAPLRTMAMVALVVMLVACANVAGLLLARGRARMRELSIRVAIGASRRRVVRQLLTEALMISIAGCAVGIVFARWIGRALVPALSSVGEPAEILTRIDWPVLGFAIATASACAVLFGLLPALRATDVQLGEGLRDAGRGAIQGAGRRLVSGGLVVVQVALSLMLLAGAGLLVRSLWNLERVDLGLDASNLLLFRIDPGVNGYDDRRSADLYTRVLDRIRATPGVAAASLSSHKLFSNSAAISFAARTDETTPEPGSAEMGAFVKTHSAWVLIVDEQFFQTMRIPLVRGRTFSTGDENGGPVAVINRSLARQMFQNDDVVGRSFRFGSAKRIEAPLEIVGIAEDARYTSVRADKPPTMYMYYRNRRAMKNPATFEVRTTGTPSALAASVRQIVREIDPSLPVFGVTTQFEQIASSLRQERLFARLATLLGAVAVILSAIGLYGLLAYAVVQRTPEIGLRMALGAGRGSVQWLLLRESLILGATGLLLGIPVTIAGTGLLQALLFGLPARDPATLAVSAAAMLLLAAAAGFVPARRAARVDPLVALRGN